jgi:hypothetical protein
MRLRVVLRRKIVLLLLLLLPQLMVVRIRGMLILHHPVLVSSNRPAPHSDFNWN